jgi:hypothetical protein
MLDAPSPAPPQSSQSTGSQPYRQMSGNNPYQQVHNSNPFGLAPSQSQHALNQAFQNMSVAATQKSQPLFPNHTGGFPGPQQPQYQQIYQQSMTPPVPNNQAQFYPPVIYENPSQQPQQSQQNTSYNPFIQQMQQPQPLQTNFSTNPYNQQQATPQNLYQSPIEQSTGQQYQSYYDNGGQQQQIQQQQIQQPQMAPYIAQAQGNHQQNINPFFQQSQPQQPQQVPQQFDYQPQQQPQYLQHAQQPHPVLPQQTGRADKDSILDLFNYPQLAPAPQQYSQPLQQAQEQTQNLANPPAPHIQQQGRSVSSPVSAYGGSKNPFAQSPTTTSQYASQNGDSLGNLGQGPSVRSGNMNGNESGHMSQESISVDTGGWTNGRHSPDAWGSISARSGR